MPVRSRHAVVPDEAEVRRVRRVAEELRARHGDLVPGPVLRELSPKTLVDAPTLHLDELGDIALAKALGDLRFFQDRARLRADDGDLVATALPPASGFEGYCRRLGLGEVGWLHPRSITAPLSPATACCTDREVRHELVRASRRTPLFYVHPHMGSVAAWTLAHLVRRASRRRVEVVAPPPALARRANDKLWFTRCVERLFGTEAVPPSSRADSLAALAHVVRATAPRFRELVVKLPDSAGGAGNLVLAAARFRGGALREVRHALGARIEELGWPRGGRWLVSAWESPVLTSASTQLWIPPPADGAPVVEGVFEQALEGRERAFVGCRPLVAPSGLVEPMVGRSWLLAALFQQLGYVGRCSFDLIVIGERPELARAKFVECNARWGGASVPMTLVNRLPDGYPERAWTTRECALPGVERLGFRELLSGLGDELLDPLAGRGSLVVYNPGSMAARGSVFALALDENRDAAQWRIEHDVPWRLRESIARSRGRRRPARPEPAQAAAM